MVHLHYIDVFTHTILSYFRHFHVKDVFFFQPFILACLSLVVESVKEFSDVH